MNSDLTMQINLLRQGLKKGPCKIRIISDSMEPLIKKDEILIIENHDVEKLNRFDIIVFEYYEKVYCHFFWSYINQNIIITKSIKDSNEFDVPINKEHFIGVTKQKHANLLLKLFIYIKILLGIK